MPKRDDDLFQRLRLAGIRKPVAQALAELTDDAGKKAVGAGHKAVAELRALIEEIEKRLPFVSQGQDEPTPVAEAPRRAVKAVTKPARARVAAASSTIEKKASVTRARRSATTVASKAAPKATSKSTAKATPKATAKPASSPAPRGANKAKILAALNGGPRTASEISDETGIATTTVSSALNRLSKTGEVSKASRGYALPK
jgi:predicted Rossmann fold nucleotide-binding protein DprA/Smf involved in DNA uptake